MNDFFFALRAFVRNPGATCVVVGTLAVAIATATIITSTIDAVWHFIPAARSDRLVFVASTDPRPGQSQAGSSNGVARTGVSIPDLVDFSERTSVFEQFAGFTFRSANLTGLDAPLRVTTLHVTHNLPDVWGIKPRLGRTFTAEEAQPGGGGHVAVVTDGFWQRQFSNARDVIGKTLMLDGEAHTIVGVLPPEAGTGLFKEADVLMPIVLDRDRAPREERQLFITGVLKPDVTLQQAAADLETVARQLQKDYPQTNAKTGVVVRPLIEMLGGNIQVVMVLLGVIAVLVVCIACANISSIILAHTAARRRELAVRAALGASRFHQIRQLMIENFVTSSFAGAAGLVLAWSGLLAIRLVSSDLDGFEMTLNSRVLTAAVALTFLAPFGFALLPAMRMSKPDMEELRQGNRGAESTRGRRLRESLVVLQVALALILVIQVGLIGRTTWKLHYLEKGFDPAQVLTLRIDLPESAYPEPRAVEDFFARALDRIQSLPGVTAAGTVTRLPIADREASIRFAIQGMPPLPSESQPQAAHSAVSADYLRTMRIPVVRGRGLVRADFENALPVALVSQEVARIYWPNQDPIGKRISFQSGGTAEWIELVGIVGNVRNSNAGNAPAPQIYTPSSWRPQPSMAFVVRSAGSDPTQLAPMIRRELAQLDGNQPVYAVNSMQRVLIDDLGGTYLLTGMLAVIGVIALFLAAAGVYGLVSYSVSQRTREIGLRMALGARPMEILGMVVTRGSVLMAIGLVLGSVGAALLASFTSSAIEEIDLRDPIAYFAASVPLVFIALIATYLPARRATHVDPLLALRAD